MDDDETSDNFENNNRGIGNNGRRRRTSWYDNMQQKEQSATKLDELIADNNSDMARYLLAGNKPKSCFARCRKGSSDDNGVDNDNQDDIFEAEEDNIRSMGKFNTDAYSLSLEPIEIRSEKIIMLAEGEIVRMHIRLICTYHMEPCVYSYRLRHPK